MNRVNPQADSRRPPTRDESHSRGDTYSSFEDIQATDIQRTKLITEAKVSRMSVGKPPLPTIHANSLSQNADLSMLGLFNWKGTVFQQLFR